MYMLQMICKPLFSDVLILEYAVWAHGQWKLTWWVLRRCYSFPPCFYSWSSYWTFLLRLLDLFSSYINNSKFTTEEFSSHISSSFLFPVLPMVQWVLVLGSAVAVFLKFVNHPIVHSMTVKEVLLQDIFQGKGQASNHFPEETSGKHSQSLVFLNLVHGVQRLISQKANYS